MTKTDNAKAKRPLARQPPSQTYDVGYGKPPVHSRFKPGQSGNPAGRPRGARNKRPALHEERLKSIILDEAYRPIKVNDGDKPVTVPMAQAIVHSLAVNAAKGNQRAQRLFTEMLATTETANKRLYNEWLETAIEYKVSWERELERRKARGIETPDPIPHPDHLVIDMSTGEVRITGPMTKEEKQQWDWLLERKVEFKKERDDLRQLLIDQPDYPHRDMVERDIEHAEKILAIIESKTQG